MTRTPDPQDDQLVPYLLGELSQAEARDLEARLASDPELAAEAQRLRQALELLPLASMATPPPGLRERVLAAARATRVHALPVRPRLQFDWRLAAAAAVVLVVGVTLPVLDAARTRRQLMVEREVHELLVQPNMVRSFMMKGAGNSAAAFGAVLLDLDDKKAAVALRGLPAPPEGQVYRLWAEVERRAVFCGQLDPDEEAIVRSQIPIPVESYRGTVSRLYVTLDPDGSPLQPVGPTVMTGT